MTSTLIGRKARFHCDQATGERVTYSARIVKVDGANAWVEIPERVRTLPFPPHGGKRYALFAIHSLKVQS